MEVYWWRVYGTGCNRDSWRGEVLDLGDVAIARRRGRGKTERRDRGTR